jgi:hypothetical protein
VVLAEELIAFPDRRRRVRRRQDLEPCLHLQRLTRPGIIKDLIHRDGLNADILSDGTISVGDRLLPDFSAERAH